MTPLDAAVAWMRSADARRWGWRPALAPSIALIVLVLLGSLVTRLVDPDGHGAPVLVGLLATAGMYVLLSVAVWWSGHDVAARYGGWGWTFGLWRPVAGDAKWWAIGFGATFVARIVVAGVASGLTDGRATKQAQNLELRTASVTVDIALVVVVVFLAPVIEELIFRGLLLRTLMRRMPFWPAAIVSTVLFGLFHTYEVDTLAGAVTLALVVAGLGLVNCLLVRATNRLTPGILVHASFNALAAIVAIAQSH